MAELTATGCFSLALTKLRTLVAASSTFQAWVGVSSAAAAAGRIFFAPIPDAHVTLPFVEITFSETEPWTLEKIAEPESYTSRGMLEMLVVAAVPVEYQGDDENVNARLWFENKLGAIIADMRVTQASGGFKLQRMDRQPGIYRTPAEKRMDRDGNVRDEMAALFTIPFDGDGITT